MSPSCLCLTLDFSMYVVFLPLSCSSLESQTSIITIAFHPVPTSGPGVGPGGLAFSNHTAANLVGLPFHLHAHPMCERRGTARE